MTKHDIEKRYTQFVVARAKGTVYTPYSNTERLELAFDAMGSMTVEELVESITDEISRVKDGVKSA